MIDEAFLSKRQKTENYMTVTTAFWTESQIFLCFAVSPCPALSLLIVTLTIMLCHKTTANGSQALILKNCLESRDAVIILRVISSRGCSGAFLSLHNTIILTTCSDRARRRAQNIYLSLDPTVPCFASVLLYPSLTIYFIILVKRK